MKKGKIIIIVAVIALILAGFLYWRRNVEIFNGSKVKNPDMYSLDFEVMNQKDVWEVSLNKDDVLVVDYSIKKGNVNLLIIDKNNNVIYKGDGIDTGKFELPISETSVYIISVDAAHSSGYIHISVK